VPTFRDIRRFVTNDHWTEEPSLARGRRRTGDHRWYSKTLPDGTRLRTKVPHGEADSIGKDLFQRILREQLQVSEDVFWDVVHGQGPVRTAQPRPTAISIPAWLVTRLIHTVGLSEDEVAELTADEALARWEAYRARPR